MTLYFRNIQTRRTRRLPKKVEALISRLDENFVFWRFANAQDLRRGELPRLIVTPGPIAEPEAGRGRKKPESGSSMASAQEADSGNSR